MPQLHHIIGAVLRDLAQARVTSDMYSRDVSSYYEQDPLLRLFPIPRTEIKEVSVDLRFAISEVEVDPDRSQDKEGKTEAVLERYSGLIADTMLGELQGLSAEKYPQWHETMAALDTPEFRKELRDAIANYLEQNHKRLISEENLLDIDDCMVGLNLIFNRMVYEREDIAQLLAKDTPSPAVAKGGVTRTVKDRLEEMQSEIQLVRDASEEYKVELDVTYDKLQALPEGAISSITITAATRNYTWSQVGEKDGQAVRRLVPE